MNPNNANWTTETMTVQEAFVAMVKFLEEFYRTTKSDDVGGLLGGLSLTVWADGGTGDPACMEIWLECVERAKRKEPLEDCDGLRWDPPSWHATPP